MRSGNASRYFSEDESWRDILLIGSLLSPAIGNWENAKVVFPSGPVRPSFRSELRASSGVKVSRCRFSKSNIESVFCHNAMLKEDFVFPGVLV